MTGFRDIAERYIAERVRYEHLANAVAGSTQLGLYERGIVSAVSPRAKGVASFLRKWLQDTTRDPFSDIRDKAGVRIVLPFRNLVVPALEVIRQRFDVIREKDLAAELESDRLGYLGYHVDVRFRDADLPEGSELQGLACEIQVHTKAQNAWSDAAHDLTYKPLVAVPVPVQRRLNRLVALVELFDQELDSTNSEISELPNYSEARALVILERQFLPIARRDYDKRLSIVTLATVLEAYEPIELEGLETRISRFVTEHAAKIREIYANYEGDERANPLLFQPEALAVFERLAHRPEALRARWDRRLPVELLDSLSEIWGIPI